MRTAKMSLEIYQKKRDFTRTPEPRGRISKTDRHRFVVQEHHASMLHFDFRLEMGGVLKSWSVRRGPSLDPGEKRLAVQTEDHPVEYLKFQGHIPEGNYGAGEHMRWDEGTYKLLEGEDPLEQLEKGRLKFELRGDKLKGAFNLVKMGGRDNQWLLIKSRDEYAKEGWELEAILKTEELKRSSRPKKRASAKGVKRLKQSVEGEVVSASSAFRKRNLSGDLNIKIGGDPLKLTNLDKVYWPKEGYTKGDLIRYYYEISKYILPYLKDRPLIMKRYPNGIKGAYFHQHDVNEAPTYVRTETLEVEEGHEVDYIVGDNLQTLIYMANLGAIERHPWHSRTEDLAHPDWLVFDMDPGKSVEFETICEVSLGTREILKKLGLEAYAKTSGSRGIHVYVPVKPKYSYDEVAEFAEGVATIVARENPEVATVERSLKRRKRGQIYVDHMQNARGKSVVAPYSVRPREGATVSAPLDWSEVERKKIRTQDFTIANVLKRVKQKGDLFKPVLKKRQGMEEAMKKLTELLNESKARTARA